MPRTAPQDVELVLGPDNVPAGTDLSPYIAAASDLVTEVCCGKGYSIDRLVKIETWVAAHFYRVAEPDTEEEAGDGVRYRFQTKVGFGFRLTSFGQTALLLDTAGGLAELDFRNNKGNKRRGTVTWLGKPSEEQ